MLEINDGNNYINVFYNIDEIYHYVTDKPRKPGRDNESEKQDGDIDFFGTESFEQAIDYLLYGDENIYNKVIKEKGNIKINKSLGNAIKRQNYEKRTYGCIPNVPAFLQGSPINMINKEPNSISHKILNIFLNTRLAGGISGSQTIELGTKYLTVIDLLEKAGYRCNLYAGCANSNHGSKNCFMLVRVKTDREPLNLKKICFAIANPGMQRRIKWKWMEVNDFDYNFTGGYGGPVEESYIIKTLNEKLKDNFIVWNYEKSGKHTIEDILKDLEKKGIKLGE